MTKLLAAAALAAVALVAGCASQPLSKAEVDGQIVCDTQQMDQVEGAARRKFATIHWLNCPTGVLRVI
jgi:outer membrane murein-binding lipoprotein Lpp